MLRKIIFLSLVSLCTLITLVNCTKLQEVESFAPGNLPQATIQNIVANGSDSLYCSISGGCPIRLTGTNFFKKARVYVGSYECEDVVISDDFTTINCNVGPAQNGVYDITVKNIDNQYSTFAGGVSATAMQFSYASFLYVGVLNSPGEVFAYAQHPTTGALLSVSGSPFSTGGDGTYGVAMSINNRFLFSANYTSQTVTTFAINPLNGRLSMVSSPMTTDGAGPNNLFVHPSGQFLYITNNTSSSVSAYSIGTDGLLSAVSGSPFSSLPARRLNGITGSSDGRFIFAAAGVTNNSFNGVAAYTVDTTTGALSLVSGTPFKNPADGSISNKGDGISIHPNGQWLYMGLFGQQKMAAWSIDQTTGALTPIGTPVDNNSPGYSDDGGSASIVSADGLFLYGTAFSRVNESNSEKIITYSINPADGSLAKISDVSTQGGPNDIRIDTTGNYAYTCNTVSSTSISAFSVNKTTGTLSPLTPAYYPINALDEGPAIMIMQINR